MYVSTRKLRRKIRKARRIFYPLFTQYSRVSAISVRNKRLYNRPILRCEERRKRESANLHVMRRIHLWNNPLLLSPPHPAPPTRKREGWTGSRARSWLRMRAWVSTGGWRGAAKGGRGRGWNRVGGGRAGGRAGEEAGCLAWEAFISPEVLNTKRGRKGTKEETTPRRPSLYPTSDGLIKNLRGENNIGRLSPRSVSFLPIFESCLCQMFPPFFPFFFSSTRRGHFD